MLAVLPQLTILLPSVSGANMASAVVLVSLAEGASVPPVVGVSEGLPPVTLGVGVGLVVEVSLGVADGVTEALADGVAEGLGVGVGRRPPRASRAWTSSWTRRPADSC